MMLRLDLDGYTAFGEAAMPPYLGENLETAEKFLRTVDLNKITPPFNMAEVHDYLEGLAPGNQAAKAALDIALHDLLAQLSGVPLYKILGSDPANMRPTACTIGIDTPEMVAKKVLEAGEFKFIKVKLGSTDDKSIINSIRRVCHKPLYVDVNQGWKNKEEALELTYWLRDEGVLWLEQPFPKENMHDQEWLMERSPLEIFADEACQRLSDIEKVKDLYTGINIKLMKSTGLFEAQKMLERARQLELNTLIGCMTETSCATMAAAALAPHFDYVDIDGPWMLAEQPFETPTLENGKIKLHERAGSGIVPLT